MILWLARSAIGAFYPRTASLPGICDMPVEAYLEQYRRESASILWAGFVLGTLLFHLTPVLTVYLPLPAFALSERLLERHTERLAAHPLYYLRQAVFVVKMVGGLLWGSHPTVRERFGLLPYPDDPGTRRQP